MQLYLLLQQSHKQPSKMLIEHTRGSIEDKSEIDKSDGALRQSTRCFNQQRLLGQPTQHVSQQPSKQPHNQLKINPEKVNVVQKSQRRTAARKSTQLSHRSTFWPRFLCQCVRSPKFILFGPCIDQSQRWSNLHGNPSCSEFRPNPSCSKFVLLPTCELKLPSRSSY